MRRPAALAALLLLTACTLPGRETARTTRTPRPRPTASGPDQLSLSGGGRAEPQRPPNMRHHRIELGDKATAWPEVLRLRYGRALAGPPEDGEAGGDHLGPPTVAVAEDGIWVYEPYARRALRFDDRGRVTARVDGLSSRGGIVAFPGGILAWDSERVMRVRDGRVSQTLADGVPEFPNKVAMGVGAVAFDVNGSWKVYERPMRVVESAGGIPEGDGSVRVDEATETVLVTRADEWEAVLLFPGPGPRRDPVVPVVVHVHVTEHAVHLFVEVWRPIPGEEHGSESIGTWYVRLGEDARLEAVERLPDDAPFFVVVAPDGRPWLQRFTGDGFALHRRG